MGVKIFCDRCNRFVKDVPLKRLNSVDNKDFICNLCIDAEKKDNAKLEKLRILTHTSVNQVANEAKETINTLIKNAEADYQKLLASRGKK